MPRRAWASLCWLHSSACPGCSAKSSIGSWSDTETGDGARRLRTKLESLKGSRHARHKVGHDEKKRVQLLLVHRASEAATKALRFAPGLANTGPKTRELVCDVDDDERDHD